MNYNKLKKAELIELLKEKEEQEVDWYEAKYVVNNLVKYCNNRKLLKRASRLIYGYSYKYTSFDERDE